MIELLGKGQNSSLIDIINLGIRRRFSPWASFALAGGGFLIGSQMGLVSGALAGVRTIKTLPNSEHLINLVRDVQ